MNSPLGVAVIGCGYWGKNYVRLCSELPQIGVVAVCDLSPERLEDAARRFPSVRIAEFPDEAIQRDDIDAVIICTDAASHYEIARQCLQHGKHVLVEKPFTTQSAHALELVQLAQARDLILMVGHVFLYNPGIEALKTYIEQGDIGEIYYLHSRRTNLGPVRCDVNAAWDLATHDVSIFNYLLGESPEWVSAVGCSFLRSGTQDAVFVTLGYPEGVRGHVHASWADPNKEREIVVVGSRMRIAFNDLDARESVRIFEKGVAAVSAEPVGYGSYQLAIRDGSIISPKIEASEPLRNQVKHFLTCITEHQQPLSDGSNGLEVVRVMEAIDLSMERNGAPVEVMPHGWKLYG